MVLVSAAWGSGIWYLLARLGLPSPVRLATVDGAHAYVGLVGGFLVVGKLARVGFRYRVPGVGGVVRWHRWVSWSLLVLYGAVFVTGTLALLPIRGRLYSNIVDLHLITSVWALAPTTWHVWHYRQRALPFLTRLRAPTLRLWAAMVLALVPAIVLLANGRGASQLPTAGGGSAWTLWQLRGDYLDRLAVAPDGSLIAAGDALYSSRDGVVWERDDLLPGPPASAGSAPPPPVGVHQHGPQPTGNTVLALAVNRDGVYAGTKSGLEWTPNPTTALVDLGISGPAVTAVAVDPTGGASIWAGTATGLMHSADRGRTWSARATGLKSPDTVTAIALYQAHVYASDGSAIYQWDSGSAVWRSAAPVPEVVDLSPDRSGRKLYVSSVTGGVWLLSDGTWQALAAPAASHQHHGHLHGALAQVTQAGSRLFASGTSDGVSASADGGYTWTQLGGGLPIDTPPTYVMLYGSDLLAASAFGLYRFHLTNSLAPTALWWIALITAAIAAVAAALLLAAPERLPGRRLYARRVPAPSRAREARSQ